LAEANEILVVEGMILEDRATVVRLSRSKALDAEEDYRYITDAVVSVLGSDGTTTPLEWNGVKGEYVPVFSLYFKDGATYILEILADGKLYRSEDLIPLRTPPIDEINYLSRNNGTQVDILLSTHDPEGKTKYYRWTYEEDWEVKMEIFVTVRFDPETNLIVDGLTRETSNNTYYCWGRETSTTFHLEDVTQVKGGMVKDRLLLHRSLTVRDTRFSYLYCFTARQYAIGEDAYAYFGNLKRNIEETGSIFAPMPAEMKGNVHCVSHPQEVVIGFLTASTESLSRLYIPCEDLPGMTYPEVSCGVIGPFRGSESMLHYGTHRILKADGADLYLWTNSRCVDCMTHNRATKNKPTFWPNDHL
jgi:hypothetical protein